MGPDWFTVIAQIINFLILVALLKRFLYGPIVRAMDRREEEIAARLADAAKKAVDAEQGRERYETLARELTEAREEMRVRAREEADALRNELLEKAREEVDRSRAQWRESFRGERESFLRSLRRHVCEEACTVARSVVTEMADSSLEERMAVCLERRIREMGTGEREELSGHFRASGEEIVVRSAFELSTEGRMALVRAVNSLTDAATLRFEVEPSLVCGVEIFAGGRSLAWNLEEHLEDLEEKLVEAMGKGSGVNGGDSSLRTVDHGN
jgi:F-type H+-transporting ATPase subunit b